MKKRSVNINIDYKTGKYVATGIVNGEKITISKPISGTDRDGYKKRSFSSKLIRHRRAQMDRDIDQVIKMYPDLKINEKLLKNADPLLYKLLEDWDRTVGGDYAIDYLRAVTEKFDEKDFAKSSKGTLDEKIFRNRKKNLKKAGIKVSYNVGLFNANSKLSLIDRIRGIRFAKKQEKIFGVNVENKLFMNKTKKDENKPIKKNSLFSIFRNKAKELKNESYRWVRSLDSKKDSIYNKKYVSDPKETKQRIIKGVATALAASSIFLNIGAVNHVMNKHKEHSENDLVYSEPIKSNNKNLNNNDTINKNNENVVFVDLDTVDLVKKQDEAPKKLTNTSKNDEEKINEFKEYAVQKYMDEFTIGNKPQVGDMLDFYTERPDGSGTIGYFKTHPNYKIGYIEVFTKDGEDNGIVIKENGKKLDDVLKDYPDYSNYCIHFENSKTGGWLGFVTKSHLDSLVEKKVDSVIKSKKSQISDFEYDDLLR